MATTTINDDSTTKKKSKKEDRKKNKHEKKEKKDRKSKERRRNDDECGEGHDGAHSHHDDSDNDVTSPGKRRKVTQEAVDEGADVKADSGKLSDEKAGDNAGESLAANSTAVAPESATTDSKTRNPKRERRQQLMAQLPARDKDGIAYTKLQLRRMRKRLERGLDPIETPREAADRARQEAEMRREEQAEWAGLLYQGSKEEEEAHSANGDEEDDDEGGEEEDGDGSDKESSSSPSNVKVVSRSDSTPAAASSHAAHDGGSGSAAKKRRDKPVPPDYVCLACQNRHQPRHWIYDCVEKVTMRGTNQVSRKHGKGAQNPKNKVFVSGLPFDATTKSVTDWFAQKCGTVATVKVLTFDDSKRCRGQAFVAFETAEAVRAALLLTGTVMTSDGTAKGTRNSSSSGKNDKGLKLKVTKALHRAATKAATSKEEKPEA